MNNNLTDNISTTSVTSSQKADFISKDHLKKTNYSNSTFIIVNKNNKLEMKNITNKGSHQQTLSCHQIPPADPLLKRTKVPVIAPKFGKMKSYM